MNESQTRLLIQRELDGNLSQEEETRLRRLLQVSDSAVSFRANLSQVVAAAHDLELPDEVRPGDSSRLALEIMENLPVAKGNFWDPLFDIFANRKSNSTDPRSARNVCSSGKTNAHATMNRVTSNSPQGKGTGLDSSQNNTALSASGSRSKVDPAVYAPKKESEKDSEKTPFGLPSVDQYVTGTHSALGGLAKKLNKNQNATPVEDVGKTLADSIREKVHEARHALQEDADDISSLIHQHAAADTVSFSETLSQKQKQFDAQPQYETQPQCETRPQFEEQPEVELQQNWAPPSQQNWAPVPQAWAASEPQSWAPPAAPSVNPPETQNPFPADVLPMATNPLDILPANITTQQRATTLNLGSSMVLTVGPQSNTIQTNSQELPEAQVAAKTSSRPVAQPATARGHDFSQDELMEWKSGTYPTVPPPAKQLGIGQTETGPLVPFQTNAVPSISKLNLKNTAEIMKQLEADAQKEKIQIPQWATPSNFNNESTDSNTTAWQNAAWPVAPSVAPAAPWPTNSAIAPPETAWVPPPTPENPAPPADPFAPPSLIPAQAIQTPWATEPASAPATVPNQVTTPVPAPVPAPQQKTSQAPANSAQEPIKAEDAIPAPTIVPVNRQSALPIEAIGDRINQLFAEPAESKPPTVVSQPAIQKDIASQENPAMENNIQECLASIGRLADVRYATNNPGNIKELGRFLLTDETIGNIGNVINKGLTHSHARVISIDTAQQMASAIDPVMKVPGVVGYLVCGYDGMAISSSLPNDVDIELLVGCTMVAYMNSHNIVRVMGHTRIKQMIFNTPGGCMLWSDFGKGILVTLTNDRDAGGLAKLTDTIASISN